MTSPGRAVPKLVWVEAKLFAREPVTVVFTFVLPILFIVILIEVFGNTPDPGFYRGMGPTDFYVPAYVGLVMAAFCLISLPVHIASYREKGVLRRFVASSIPTGAVLFAQVVVTAVAVTAGGIVIVLIGFVRYDLGRPADLPGTLFAFVLGVTMFCLLGLVIAAMVPNSRSAQGVGLVAFFTMMMISGGGPPVEVLPGWLGTAGGLLPLRHVVTSLQDPWHGVGWNVGELAVVSGFLLVSALVLGWFLSRRN